MTRRNLPGSAYANVPNAKILSGDFSPLLTATNMTYAAPFKVGTVFQPGTLEAEKQTGKPGEKRLSQNIHSVTIAENLRQRQASRRLANWLRRAFAIFT